MKEKGNHGQSFAKGVCVSLKKPRLPYRPAICRGSSDVWVSKEPDMTERQGGTVCGNWDL